ncbi:MAG: hypothetical protein WAX37_02680 [Minisyncoccia bacterium]
MFSKNFVIVSVILGLVVGVAVGMVVSSGSPQLGVGLSATQIEKLKKMFPIMTELRNISGTVKEISGNVVTVKIAEPSNPFDQYPTERQVVIDSETSVTKSVQSDQKEFQKQWDAYIKSNSKTSTPPSPIKEVNINLSDIKVGDVISVLADHNIKNEIKFTGKKVLVGLDGSAGGPAGLGSVPPPPPPVTTGSSGATVPPPPPPPPVLR